MKISDIDRVIKALAAKVESLETAVRPSTPKVGAEFIARQPDERSFSCERCGTIDKITPCDRYGTCYRCHGQVTETVIWRGPKCSRS